MEGDWTTKSVHKVEIGDETLINGEWQMVTAVGGAERGIQRLFFGAHVVVYPSNSDLMIRTS